LERKARFFAVKPQKMRKKSVKKVNAAALYRVPRPGTFPSRCGIIETGESSGG
jgi:hypothetical protein